MSNLLAKVQAFHRKHFLLALPRNVELAIKQAIAKGCLDVDELRQIFEHPEYLRDPRASLLAAREAPIPVEDLEHHFRTLD